MKCELKWLRKLEFSHYFDHPQKYQRSFHWKSTLCLEFFICKDSEVMSLVDSWWVVCPHWKADPIYQATLSWAHFSSPKFSLKQAGFLLLENNETFSKWPYVAGCVSLQCLPSGHMLWEQRLTEHSTFHTTAHFTNRQSWLTFCTAVADCSLQAFSYFLRCLGLVTMLRDRQGMCHYYFTDKNPGFKEIIMTTVREKHQS